jgi:hypothetical protein
MTLKITALVLVFLLTLHIAQDIVLGFAPGGLGNITVLVVGGGLLFSMIELSDRRSGKIIALIAGLVSIGVSIIHMTKSGLTGPHSKPGGVPFVLVVLATGVTGVFCAALAARGLFAGRSRNHSASIEG